MSSIDKQPELLSDYDYTDSDFDDLLDGADINACKSEELNFVSHLREEFEEHGQNMHLSPKQLQWLINIVNEDYDFGG